MSDPNDSSRDQLSPPVTLRLRPDRRRTQRGIPEINRRHDDWIWAAGGSGRPESDNNGPAGPEPPRPV